MQRVSAFEIRIFGAEKKRSKCAHSLSFVHAFAWTRYDWKRIVNLRNSIFVFSNKPRESNGTRFPSVTRVLENWPESIGGENNRSRVQNHIVAYFKSNRGFPQNIATTDTFSHLPPSPLSFCSFTLHVCGSQHRFFNRKIHTHTLHAFLVVGRPCWYWVHATVRRLFSLSLSGKTYNNTIVIVTGRQGRI